MDATLDMGNGCRCPNCRWGRAGEDSGSSNKLDLADSGVKDRRLRAMHSEIESQCGRTCRERVWP